MLKTVLMITVAALAPLGGGAAALASPVGDGAEVLVMDGGLRDRLGGIFQKEANPHTFADRVDDADGTLYGRVGSTYYAVVPVWFRDSPVKNTDAGSLFVRERGGDWRLVQKDGAQDCAHVPGELAKAWGISTC